MSAPITAHCICENHSFTVEPQAIKFGFASCHCSKCRLSHAAPFVMWSGVKADCASQFCVLSKPDATLSSFRTSENCVRYFCSNCGTHLYIEYDSGKEGSTPWSGEVHFPTALLDDENVTKLEQVISEMSKPRYLHVFTSDKSKCLGDLNTWVNAPKYGGETGLEPMES